MAIYQCQNFVIQCDRNKDMSINVRDAVTMQTFHGFDVLLLDFSSSSSHLLGDFKIMCANDN